MAAKTRAPLRVLIVRVGAMGDVLHGLPAVAALRSRIPECFIGWAVETRWAALLAAEGTQRLAPHVPVVDRVHPVRTRAWKAQPFSGGTLRGIAALRRELRAEEYDVCVDLQGSLRSAAIGWMAGARRFVGAAEPREWLAREFYGERVEVREEHVIGQACELLRAGVKEFEPSLLQPTAQDRSVGHADLGLSLDLRHPVELPVDAAAEQWAAELVERLPLQPTSQDRRVGHRGTMLDRDLDNPHSFVLLSPGAGWGAKRWALDRYGELARRMRATSYRVLVNGGADDGEAEEIARGGGAETVVCSVAQLVALTRRAALVIGGDTGPVHLAAALGRPVVALFGPTDPRRTGPYFPEANVTVLRNSASVVSHKRMARTEAGLARIRVEEVFQAAMTMLKVNGNADG